VSQCALSSAPDRHEVGEELALPMPHCIRGRDQRERAASGTSTRGSGRGCVPRFAVTQRHRPGPEAQLGDTSPIGGAGGAGRVAAVPPGPGAHEEQAEWVSRWWTSAGKGNTSLTTCLSSASATKYPPHALGQLHNGEQRPNQKYSWLRWSGLRH